MRIIIPGEPIVKKRPKFSTLRGCMRTYDPQEKEKQAAKRELSIALDLLRIEHEDFLLFHSLPLNVSLQYYISPFRTDTPAKKNAKLWGTLWEGRKDIDNYLKWNLDIANGILWGDDRQITHLQASIKYSETPCTILNVEAIKISMNDDAERLTRIFSPSALEKLESDLHVLACALESVRLCHGEDRTKHQEFAGAALKSFANDYSHALKKMISKDGK